MKQSQKRHTIQAFRKYSTSDGLVNGGFRTYLDRRSGERVSSIARILTHCAGRVGPAAPRAGYWPP
jgi:hypothetical protein